MKYIFIVVLISCLILSKAQENPCNIPWNSPNYHYLEPNDKICGLADPDRLSELVFPEDEEPIIHGRMINADIGQELGTFPWLARVFATFTGLRAQNKCLGAIIGTKWVLTVGSCLYLDAIRASIITAIVGDNILKARDCKDGKCAAEPQSIRVQTAIVHSDYTMKHNSDGDIALLKLYYSITYNGFVRPICLPFQCIDPYLENHKIYMLAGYGEVEKLAVLKPGENPYETRVVITKVRGLLKEECQARWREYRPPVVYIDSDNHICAQPVSDRGKPCDTDLGGPLMVQEVNSSAPAGTPPKYWLLGLLSFGSACNDVPDTKSPPPLVFQNVARRQAWITSNLDGSAVNAEKFEF